MSPLSEQVAEQMPPAQAADLARVLESHANWENLRAAPRHVNDVSGSVRLRGLQSAYEAYQTTQSKYTARFRSDQLPDTYRGRPAKIAAWCRVVRAVLRRAAGEPGAERPTQIVEMAFRMADQSAANNAVALIARGQVPVTTEAAIAGLDAVIRWCDGQTAPTESAGGLQLPIAPAG